MTPPSDLTFAAYRATIAASPLIVAWGDYLQGIEAKMRDHIAREHQRGARTTWLDARYALHCALKLTPGDALAGMYALSDGDEVSRRLDHDGMPSGGDVSAALGSWLMLLAAAERVHFDTPRFCRVANAYIGPGVGLDQMPPQQEPQP